MIQEAKYRAANVKDSVGEGVNKVRDAAKAGADAFKAEIRHIADVDTEL